MVTETDKFRFMHINTGCLRLGKTTRARQFASLSLMVQLSHQLVLSPSPSLPPALGRGLAFRRDSLQVGAVCPKSFCGDHSAESVRFEYWQVKNTSNVQPKLTLSHMVSSYLQFLHKQWGITNTVRTMTFDLTCDLLAAFNFSNQYIDTYDCQLHCELGIRNLRLIFLLKCRWVLM